MGKFNQSIQSYGPSFMTKFCSALYLENLLTNIFAKLNLRCGVSCMPAVLLFKINQEEYTSPMRYYHTVYCAFRKKSNLIWIIGELIVYPCSGVCRCVHASVRPSVVHNFKDLLL